MAKYTHNFDVENSESTFNVTVSFDDSAEWELTKATKYVYEKNKEDVLVKDLENIEETFFSDIDEEIKEYLDEVQIEFNDYTKDDYILEKAETYKIERLIEENY